MNLSNLIAQRPNKTIYRDGDRVVKVMNEEFLAADVLNEAHNHAIVQAAGFPVPALHEVCKVDGKWAIVMDFVEGRTLASMLDEDPKNAAQYIERLVDIQMDMHSYKADRLRHLSDKFHDKINQSGLDSVVRYELHNRLQGLPKRNKLCHGDFTPGNVIITPDNRVVVVDWSHATQGSASADAARTYLRLVLAGQAELAETYLQLFCQKNGTEQKYVNKWLAIVAASQMVKRVPAERELLLRWANIIEFNG
ncbi:MAG: aminoglycoside phosphotransferase family protein [Oscillospiraceae bacterium]|nr:aminoglycoside phosphotransferase family protein [Oscillospiraceae bacterium]